MEFETANLNMIIFNPICQSTYIKSYEIKFPYFICMISGDPTALKMKILLAIFLSIPHFICGFEKNVIIDMLFRAVGASQNQGGQHCQTYFGL